MSETSEIIKEARKAGMQKDISESFKNLIKVHVMTSEHSVEKY